MFDLDEERARAMDEGAIAHSVIATLAAETRAPSLARVQQLVDRALVRFAAIEARAHRQNIRGAVHRYFTRCLPPARFVFGGAEHDLGVGRADLIWFDFDDLVLGDEIKIGSPRNLRLTTTLDQVDRYRRACLDTWKERFAGIRLLCPTDPTQSVFIDPAGLISQLATTAYLERG